MRGEGLADLLGRGTVDRSDRHAAQEALRRELAIQMQEQKDAKVERLRKEKELDDLYEAKFRQQTSTSATVQNNATQRQEQGQRQQQAGLDGSIISKKDHGSTSDWLAQQKSKALPDQQANLWQSDLGFDSLKPFRPANVDPTVAATELNLEDLRVDLDSSRAGECFSSLEHDPELNLMIDGLLAEQAALKDKVQHQQVESAIRSRRVELASTRSLGWALNPYGRAGVSASGRRRRRREVATAPHTLRRHVAVETGALHATARWNIGNDLDHGAHMDDWQPKSRESIATQHQNLFNKKAGTEISDEAAGIDQNAFQPIVADFKSSNSMSSDDMQRDVPKIGHMPDAIMVGNGVSSPVGTMRGVGSKITSSEPKRDKLDNHTGASVQTTHGAEHLATASTFLMSDAVDEFLSSL